MNPSTCLSVTLLLSLLPAAVPAAAGGGEEGTGLTRSTVVLQRVDLAKVMVAPGESSVATVRTNAPNGTPGSIALTLHDLRGRLLHRASAPMSPLTNFALPAVATEGAFRLRVELPGSGFDGALERVHSVVARPADDIRYGFYARYDTLSPSYAEKNRLLAECHLTAMEYYDYFPGHGDYAPQQEEYTNEPFASQFIRTADIRGKADAGRARNIAAVAYIAAYAAVPRIADQVPDHLFDGSGTPLVFYQGNVGTESSLGGTWFRLMAFAPDTDWFAFLRGELEAALDGEPTDRVEFDGFEIDTYGYQGTYRSAASDWNGRTIAEALAAMTGEVRDLVHARKPRGLVALNTISEEGIELVYDKADFLFIENWDFHKPRYDQVAALVFQRHAASGLRVVTKSYPADMEPARTRWPAANLRLLMAAHLAGGGSLMVAGEPDEATGRIGGLNSLYYPDYQLQTEENAAIIRACNAHDAALFGLNHGPGVAPVATDLQVPGGLATSFRAADGTMTWCLLRTGANERWTTESSLPPSLQDVTLDLTLPNGLFPAMVLHGTPDDTDRIYPKPVPWTLADGRVTCTIPSLATFGSVVVVATPHAPRLADSAADPAYGNGWIGSPGGGTGWTTGWTFGGLEEGTGAFVGPSTGNGTGWKNGDGDIDTGRRSLGLYSGTSGLMDAVRDFPPLRPGEAFRIHLDNGFVRQGGAAGFGLHDAAGGRLFEFFFRGGTDSYIRLDAQGERQTGIPFTEDGLDIQLTALADNRYALRVVPLGAESQAVVLEGALAGGWPPARLRVFSFQAGTGAPYDMFINTIGVYPAAGPKPMDRWEVL